MAVESAADLAGMFDTADHADAIQYRRPPGAFYAAAAIMETASDVFSGIRAGSREATIRTSDLPSGSALRGDEIQLSGGAVYRVESADRDTIGATWRLTLAAT